MYVARIGDTLIIPLLPPSDNRKVSVRVVEKLANCFVGKGAIFSSAHGLASTGKPMEDCSWYDHVTMGGQKEVPKVFITVEDGEPFPIIDSKDHWVSETISPDTESWVVGMKDLISRAGELSLMVAGNDVDKFIATMDQYLHGRTGSMMYTLDYNVLIAFLKKANVLYKNNEPIPSDLLMGMFAEGKFKQYQYPNEKIIHHKS